MSKRRASILSESEILRILQEESSDEEDCDGDVDDPTYPQLQSTSLDCR